MGLVDEIHVNGKEGQVKCFEPEMRTFREGDEVPDIEPGEWTFSIAMREGGYVNVEDNIILSWTDEPEFTSIYDKWGNKHSRSSVGLLGENYFL